MTVCLKLWKGGEPGNEHLWFLTQQCYRLPAHPVSSRGLR